MNTQTPASAINALPRVTIRDVTDSSNDFTQQFNGMKLSPTAGDRMIIDGQPHVVISVSKAFNMDVAPDEPVLREIGIVVAPVTE